MPKRKDEPKKEKKPWRKILYEDQDYPDNYTDPTFLRDLRTSVQYISLSEAIKGASVILQELCTVAAFTLVYVYLYNEWIAPEQLLQWSSSLTIVGYIIYRVKYATNNRETLGDDLRTVLIYMVFTHLFSPVLHNLTDTISTNTIYTMTFFMMLVHLITFDYGVDAAVVSKSLSFNAAIFSSICLASRLSSAFHAFILITVAVECFVLFPLLKDKIGKPVVVSVMMLAIDIYFLMIVSNLFLVLFIACVAFINIVCPWLFVREQKHKLNIYGPWDEAVVDNADDLVS